MDYIYSSNEVWTTLDDPANATALSYDQLLSEYDKATANNKTYLDTINKLQLSNSLLMHQIDHLEQYLTDSFESIDEDTLQALAEIFEFDLSREVVVTISAEIRTSIRLPLDKTVDDLDWSDFDISVDSSQYDIEFTDVVDINVSE